MDDFRRIVIVAYRLPFSIRHRNGALTAVQNSGGLVSAVLSLTERMKKGLRQPVSHSMGRQR